MRKNYQRRHLRAPYKEHIICADGSIVYSASTLNLSEGGVLIDKFTLFSQKDEISILMPIQDIPSLRNFSLLKMQTFSPELFKRQIIRAQAKLARRVELAHDHDNIFHSRFGLEFIKVSDRDKKIIENYVSTFSANLIYLQTLIDSYNTDEDTKMKVRVLAKILGYNDTEKISQLRSDVTSDYKSLQWL